MGESQIKVGDVVAWADVPIGSLVVDKDACFFNRQEDGGRCVGSLDRCTIVALGLTGNESAAELFALAHPTP